MVVSVPVGDSAPVQEPEAVQVVTPVEVQVSFVVEPLLTVVGLAVRVTVGAAVWSTGSVTDTAKGVRSAVVVPSLVLMVMFE